MLSIGLNVALAALALSFLFCCVRLARGPGLADRILALDALYVNAIVFLVMLGIRTDTTAYFEAALLIAMFGFVGTVALARHLRCRIAAR